MASKLSVAFLLLILLSIVAQPSVSIAAQEPSDHHHGLKVGKISSALSSKGYISMSLILEETLTTLVSSSSSKNTTVTIFSPLDKAFFSSSKYPQPPFTLLQYHIVPSKLDREVLESSLPFESKVDTLLPGHPLVVTTLPGRPSINGVKITEWDLYNDGRVIVHGVEDFFDPAFQTLLYPWYGDEVTQNEGESSAGSNCNMDTKDSTQVVGGISPAKGLQFFVLSVLIFSEMCLFLAWTYCRDPEDGEYFYIQ